MHSFTSCLVHCVWSTKNREPWLTLDLRERLWPYLGGIAKQNQIRTLAIGGVGDHDPVYPAFHVNRAVPRGRHATQRKTHKSAGVNLLLILVLASGHGE